MKTYVLLSLVLLTGCASSRIVQMSPPVPGRILPPEQLESVRYAESVKGYPVSRYIDPNNNLVMHEQHVIFRVETTARWNLHPDGPAAASFGPPVAIIDSARSNAPVNAEIIAEVNKQKAATQALLDQGAKFDQSLSQLAGAFTVVKQVGEQNLQMKQELSLTEKRLDALEEQLRNKQAGFSAGANQNTNEW